MVARGARSSMEQFGVPESVLAAPHFQDFFQFLFVHMMVIGLLIGLLGGLIDEGAKQRLAARALFGVETLYTYLDVRTSDSPLGNGLYQGAGSLMPVLIDLLVLSCFGYLSVRPLRFAHHEGSLNRPDGRHPRARRHLFAMGWLRHRLSPSRKAHSVSKIAARLAALNIVLPQPMQLPPGLKLPFPWVKVVGNRALISGHGPTHADGSIALPVGKVGRDVSEQQAYQAARLTGLSILGSLQRELGDLDRIATWVRIFGMVNSAPGFNRQPAVINGFTELIIDVFGPDIGSHTRSAVGLAELPLDTPVEIEGEVLLR